MHFNNFTIYSEIFGYPIECKYKVIHVRMLPLLAKFLIKLQTKPVKLTESRWRTSPLDNVRAAGIASTFAVALLILKSLLYNSRYYLQQLNLTIQKKKKNTETKWTSSWSKMTDRQIDALRFFTVITIVMCSAFFVTFDNNSVGLRGLHVATFV